MIPQTSKKITNVFLDTEFNHDTLELLSIALVKENGDHLYRVVSGVDYSKCDEFVRDTVVPLLLEGFEPIKVMSSREQLKKDIENFLHGNGEYYKIWAWFSSYDWVLFQRLWGKNKVLPLQIPYYCNDWRQKLDDIGLRFSPRLYQFDKLRKHNALYDAQVLREAFMSARKAGKV